GGMPGRKGIDVGREGRAEQAGGGHRGVRSRAAHQVLEREFHGASGHEGERRQPGRVLQPQASKAPGQAGAGRARDEPRAAAAGVAAVAYLVATTGVERLLGPVRTLSWRIAVFIALPYALVAFLHTVAWRLIFVRRPFSLRQLFSVRLAGEAVNLGTASVGGEPVKVYLLRPWVPMAEASATLVVDKTAITIGQVLFLAAGLVVAVGSFPLRPDFLRAMAALLGLQIVVVAAFVLVQYAGLGGWTLRALDRLGFGSARARMSGLVRFDRMLAAS